MNVILNKKSDLPNSPQTEDMCAQSFVIKKIEDPGIFKSQVDKLDLLQPGYAIIYNVDELIRLAKILKYPLIVKLTNPLENQHQKIVYNDIELVEYLKKVSCVSETHPLLLEHFINDAIKINISGIYAGGDVFILSSEHTSYLKSNSAILSIEEQIKEKMKKLAYEIGITGLICAQFIVKVNQVYVVSFRVE